MTLESVTYARPPVRRSLTLSLREFFKIEWLTGATHVGKAGDRNPESSVRAEAEDAAADRGDALEDYATVCMMLLLR